MRTTPSTGRIGRVGSAVVNFFSAIGDAAAQMAADEYPRAEGAFTGRARPADVAGRNTRGGAGLGDMSGHKDNVWFSAYDR